MGLNIESIKKLHFNLNMHIPFLLMENRQIRLLFEFKEDLIPIEGKLVPNPSGKGIVLFHVYIESSLKPHVIFGNITYAIPDDISNQDAIDKLAILSNTVLWANGSDTEFFVDAIYQLSLVLLSIQEFAVPVKRNPEKTP